MSAKSRIFRIAAGIVIGGGLAALIAWGGVRLYRTAASELGSAPDAGLPSTTVKRGDVTVSVYARAELQGGNSQMLTAPMAGGGDMIITDLRKQGELVKEGEVVAQFDTTDQINKLREAEADLAEAEQKVLQAQAQAQAKEEEDHYALLKARADMRQAELEVRKNPLVSAIAAKQADLALESARAALSQLERDLGNRKATSQAGVQIQEAIRAKAKVQGEEAQKNIDAMTLRTKLAGYVSLQPNMNGNRFFQGMHLPALQVGDTIQAGMAVAQIPDMTHWEASAKISELDQGHLAVGQKVRLTAVALPDHPLTGAVKAIGGVGGPQWDRRFECRISVDHPPLELRPGMTANIVITEETLKNVLWIPAQALFESDGRTFVYLRSPEGSFTPQNVKMVRRSESQVVVEGLADGSTVALASPGSQKAKDKDAKKGGRSATQALPK